jgi:hypothetical protein
VRRLRSENDDLRATIADQGQKINTLRRVLDFLGFEVSIDD